MRIVNADERRELLQETNDVALTGRVGLPSGDSPLLPSHISGPLAVDNFPCIVQTEMPPDTDPNGPTPEEITGAACAVGSFLDGEQDTSEGSLLKHGAVLFKGLPIRTPEDFSVFAANLGWTVTTLVNGGTERSILAANVRTASDEPANHTIEPHCDMAHNPVFPGKIAFFMLEGPPANVGGETVLVDIRNVTAQLKASGLSEVFESHGGGGVMYRKVLWSAQHVDHSFTWQKRFFTEDRDEVDAKLRAMGNVIWRWTENDVLEFENTQPATTTHPVTGEELWFNGIHTNHKTYYETAPHIDTSLGSPMNALFGDGEEIDDETLALIRSTWWDNAVALALTSGDLCIVDNMLAGHGRMGWIPPHPRRMLLTHFE